MVTDGDRRSWYHTVCIPESLFSVPRQSNRLRLQERSNFRMADLSDAVPPPLAIARSVARATCLSQSAGAMRSPARRIQVAPCSEQPTGQLRAVRAATFTYSVVAISSQLL